METVRQFSIPLANKPGRLAGILAAFNKEKVGIRAFCVMDSASRGTLRLVADDDALAANALQTINVPCECADVLLVNFAGNSGGLPHLCERLAIEHLNVDYAYGASGPASAPKSRGAAVVKVNDLAKAQRILSELGSNHQPKPNKRPGRRPKYAR